MMDITRNNDTAGLAQATVSALSAILETGNTDGVLLLLSGGSALSLVEHMELPEGVIENLTIGMIDERYDIDPTINNYLLLQQTKFSQDAEKAGVSFISSVPTQAESLDAFAERMALSWKYWMHAHPAGKIAALLGVGPDGHTAGVLPFPEDPLLFGRLFTEPSCMAVGYNARGKHQYPKRATATLAFLKDHVDEAIVFMSGVSKAPALRDILSVEGDLCRTPARIFNSMTHVRLFTDISSI